MADIAPVVNGKELLTLLCKAEDAAHPIWRRLHTTHWVMNLEWYKAIRRASLPPDLPPDDEARDEAKWEPQHGDTVLGYDITVTEDGGQPHLVDGRPADVRERIRWLDPTLAG
jgi:hypothetical protein